MNKKPGYALISSILIIAVVVFVMSGASASGYITGKVIDNSTLQPIKGAIVTINDYIVETDEKGFFKITTAAQKVSVRAHGYSRTEQLITAPPLLISPFYSTSLTIKLAPFTPKALYLSFYGAGSKTLRESALRLIDTQRSLTRWL